MSGQAVARPAASSSSPIWRSSTTPINQITQSWGLIAGARVGARAGLRGARHRGRSRKTAPGSFLPKARAATIAWHDVSFRYRRRDAGAERRRPRRGGRARRSRSSARPAPASRRCSACCRGSSIRSPAASTIDGVDVRDYKLKSLRSQIAMVLQPPLIFPLSVRDNIAYGRPGADDAAIERGGAAGSHP